MYPPARAFRRRAQERSAKTPAVRSALRVALVVLMAAIGIVLAPGVALAQDVDPQDGVLVRVAGDATVAPGEQVAAVVVVSGDLVLEGAAEVVVVVDGRATLSNATVDTLVVVQGTVDLADGTVVTGDVWIPDSTLIQDQSSRIEGDIVEDVAGYAGAFFIFGVLFSIGLGIFAILAALIMAAVAPMTARRATSAIRSDLPQVLVSGVIFWIALPTAAILLLLTVVGIPTALAIWAFALPVTAFVGYLVAAILVGEAIVRDQADTHPYKSAAVGALVLGALSVVPVVGAVIGTVSALLGGSALALLGWRSIRGRPAVPASATDEQLVAMEV